MEHKNKEKWIGSSHQISIKELIYRQYMVLI